MEISSSRRAEDVAWFGIRPRNNDRDLCRFPREILAEIKRLRTEHEAACQASPEKGSTNPTLLAELRLLR